MEFSWNDEIVTKCDIKASELRNEGNIFYKQSKFYNALLKYNESLCFAKTNETLALAYANRSAVYLEKKFYKQCLNNIRLAREHNYPIEKIKSLDDRKAKCMNMKKKDPRVPTDPFEHFKLSYKANKKYPFIIEGLKLESDEKFGRKIVAQRSLEIGDVICIESPYYKIKHVDAVGLRVDPKSNFNYCSLCFIDNYMDLLPCAGCTNTMFCNKNCEKIALQQYHKYMCEANSERQLLTYTFFKALDVMNGSIEDLQQLFEECLKSPKTIFDFDFSNQNDPDYSENQLKVALSLARKNATFPYIFDPKVFKAFGFWSTHAKFIFTFLNHLYQIKCAAQGSFLAWKFLGTSRHEIGSVTCLFSALINHSCAPNVQRFCIRNKLSLIVIRPIKKGEQLFDCYGSHFIEKSVSERQEFLNNYSFKCDCEACLNPGTYKVNPMKEKNVFDNMDTLGKILEQRGSKYLMYSFKPMLQKLYSDKHYTSQEYHTLLFALHQFFLLLANTKD